MDKNKEAQIYTENKMQEIAEYVKSQLPEDWGFMVMAFPFGNTSGRVNYVSNAKRKDVVDALYEFITRTEEQYGKHIEEEPKE